jgi:hypothetical protein
MIVNSIYTPVLCENQDKAKYGANRKWKFDFLQEFWDSVQAILWTPTSLFFATSLEASL